MKFVSVAVEDSVGSLLAHSHKGQAIALKKGHLLSQDDCRLLLEDGVMDVSVAQLDAGDIPENQAASRLAAVLSKNGLRAEEPFTGRANLYAEKTGMFLANSELVAQLNRIDPAITLATLSNDSFVEQGRMVATVKIIPFAVSGEALSNAESVADSDDVLKFSPAKVMRVGLIATRLPNLKTATMDKTRRILEQRLAPSGSEVVEEIRVAHTTQAISDALNALRGKVDIAIVFGASAITDRADVIPAGLEKSGGTIVHLGMPVDPGNLLLIGQLGGIPVVGAPGCARSPAENGFDWVLNRLTCGLSVDSSYIISLGVGGLLMEISSRTQPREG